MIRYMWKTRQKIENVAEKLRTGVYTCVSELKVEGWKTAEPVPFAERDKQGEYKEYQKGEKWGDLFDCCWFHFTGRVPDEAKGKHVVLLIDVNGEGCVYDKNGVAVRGITNVSAQANNIYGRPGKRVLQFADKAKGGEKVDIWVDAGCNDLTGNFTGDGRVRDADVAICDDARRDLFYDYQVLMDMMTALPEESSRQKSIFYALYAAAHTLLTYSPDEISAAHAILRREMDKKGGDPSLTIAAEGHAHLDLAWLWPIRETKRKAERTFSTALSLMDRYPEYIFGASQAILYEWIKQRQPELFEKIRKRVKEGRWEIQGAMWVEADSNMTGAESLVRQLLYGKRYFRKEFGEEIRTCWLPDVFGFSAAMPQILKKSGVDYFMTMKLASNLITKFPFHTFFWQGIDGTKILSHMLPEGNYVSAARPSSLLRMERDFIEKGRSDYALNLFGIGDGGGGPGPEFIERVTRQKNLAGLPPVVQMRAVDFFDKINEKTELLDTWVGELYMERHQGCLTSQALTKLYNRQMERELRELEFAQNMARLLAGATFEDEKDELTEIWRDVLLYQFHDILPGSSYNRVYDEVYARYGELLARAREMTDEAYGRIAKALDPGQAAKPRVLFNSLSWDRTAWIEEAGKWKKASVPATGYNIVDMAEDHGEAILMKELAFGKNFIENAALRVTFAADGSISGITDKKYGREVVTPGGAANRLVMFEDNGDAWDFDVSYHSMPEEQFALKSSKTLSDGPRVIMRQEYARGNSIIRQDVCLTAGDDAVEFVTDVDWQESSHILKTISDIDVFADSATYDIQFGQIKRPTHDNLPQDYAKYEAAGHKFADVSSRDYGVALLNDCKFGYRIKGGTMELSLLRGSEYPAKGADRGKHHFRYAIYPHTGDESAGGVARKAYEFNIPVRIAKADESSPAGRAWKKLPGAYSLITPEKGSGNVIIETIKPAEEGDALIVRMYERTGARTEATFKLNFEAESASLTDLMEEHPQKLALSKDGRVKVAFKPFEIQTLMINIRGFRF